MVHHRHAVHHALTDHRARSDCAIDVEQLDPVVVLDAGLARIVLAQPHDRPAARQGLHQQVVAVGTVDAPLLMRGDPVEYDLAVAVAALVEQRFDGSGIDWRTVAHEALAEGHHPFVILIELLATGQGAPRNQLVDVGVAGVVADMLVLQARPDRRRDNLARLRLDIAEADCFVFLARGQMGVLAAGELAQRFPCLDRHMTVGLRRQRQDHLAGIDRAFDPRTTLADALVEDAMVEIAKERHFIFGIPVYALAAVAQFLKQRAERGELLVQIRIVAFDHHHRWEGLAGNRFALALLPVAHVERHGQFARRVVQGRHHDQVLLDAEHARRHVAHRASNALEDVPVAARFPRRIHRFRQRVDEWMHVGCVEVVLLVPGRGRQHYIRIQRGGAHAEVERDQQVEFSFRRFVAPGHFFGLDRAHLAQILALQTVARAEHVPQHVLVALAGRTEQIRAPDEHRARKVLRRIRIGVGEVQRAGFHLCHHVVSGRLPGLFGRAHDLERIAIQLRRTRQPAHAYRAQVQIHQSAAVLRRIGQRRQNFLHLQLLVAPLVGIEIEERRAVHLP